MIERYARSLIRWRWLVIAFTVLVTLGIGSGGRFLVFTNDYRVFFGPDNPQLLAFDELTATYTKSDNLFIMLEPKSGTVFDKATLAAVVDATDRAWQVPYSIRVDSISNFQHTSADGDDMFVEELVEDAEILEAADIERIKAIALDQPTLVDKLLSSPQRSATQKTRT